MLLIFFGLVLCSIGVALGVDSSRCISECFYTEDASEYGKVGYFCYISYTESAECIPRPLLDGKNKNEFISPAYRYNSQTYKNGCHGKCGYFGDDFLWCFDNSAINWDYCSASEIIEYEPWQNITKKIKSFVDTRSGLSGTCDEIVKKSVGSFPITEILNVIEKEKKHVYHETLGYRATNPINKIHKIFVPGFEDRPETNLTLGLSARIYPSHVRSHHPADETPEAKEYYTFLNPGKDDLIGHILATALGGTNDYDNLVPINLKKVQTSANTVSCNLGSLRNQIDSSVNQFLKSSQGYVEYNVIVYYGGLPTSLRATHFILQIKLFHFFGVPFRFAEYPLKGEGSFSFLIRNDI